MKRLFEEKLYAWKNNTNHKPLMVIGVRQIGKTYLINKFCKENYEDYYYFNIEQETWLREIFEKTINIEEVLELLELKLAKKIDLDKSVFFFDEVQVSERFIMALKYFCEYNKKINIICAGSLLGVKINRFNNSFPVGKVQMEYMYPMNFEEFLLATGEELLVDKIKNCFAKNEPLEKFLHEKAINIYRNYLCIGGMPESVSDYINKEKDILLYDKSILSNIIDMYIADMSKYTLNKNESIKNEKVYRSINLQLGNENNKFKYSEVEEGSKKSKYESSLDWLISSNLVLKSNNIKVPNIPVEVYKDEYNFKMYLSDVGILTRISNLNFSNILLDDEFMYKGAITENYVANEFVNKGLKLYYWSSERTAEVDFILTDQNKVIPVEVKSKDNTKSKSLNEYINKYNPAYSIRISTKNFGFENNIKSIPLYAVFCLVDDIVKNNY